VVASGLRGDDWLARSGPTEFAVLGTGPVTGAQALAGRLVELVGAAAVRGTWANAGLAALAEDASASEVLRRATLCLSTARAMGAGRVITYGGTR
jgi:GGDEF domain-containing protein